MGIAELGARPSFGAKVLNLCGARCDCACNRLCGSIAPSMHLPENACSCQAKVHMCNHAGRLP
eukprot:9133739-Alexandrium_andersonii.AAC.1